MEGPAKSAKKHVAAIFPLLNRSLQQHSGGNQDGRRNGLRGSVTFKDDAPKAAQSVVNFTVAHASNSTYFEVLMSTNCQMGEQMASIQQQMAYLAITLATHQAPPAANTSPAASHHTPICGINSYTILDCHRPTPPNNGSPPPQQQLWQQPPQQQQQQQWNQQGYADPQQRQQRFRQ